MSAEELATLSILGMAIGIVVSSACSIAVEVAFWIRRRLRRCRCDVYQFAFCDCPPPPRLPRARALRRKP